MAPIAPLAPPVDNEELMEGYEPQWSDNGIFQDSRSEVSSGSEDSHPDSHLGNRWVYDFPEPAGVALGTGESHFVQLKKAQDGMAPWAPFEDLEEWELAWWIATHVGQNAANELLKLPIVSTR